MRLSRVCQQTLLRQSLIKCFGFLLNISSIRNCINSTFFITSIIALTNPRLEKMQSNKHNDNYVGDYIANLKDQIESFKNEVIFLRNKSDGEKQSDKLFSFPKVMFFQLLSPIRLTQIKITTKKMWSIVLIYPTNQIPVTLWRTLIWYSDDRRKLIIKASVQQVK